MLARSRRHASPGSIVPPSCRSSKPVRRRTTLDTECPSGKLIQCACG
jgi:hypothetical protein